MAGGGGGFYASMQELDRSDQPSTSFSGGPVFSSDYSRDETSGTGKNVSEIYKSDEEDNEAEVIYPEYNVNAVYEGTKKYPCNQCKMSFFTEKALDAHLHSKHMGNTKHTCEHCGKTFTRLRELRRHEMKVKGIKGPEKLRAFACTQCDRMFVKEKDMKKHASIMHASDNKQYGCIHCGKTFPHPKSLQAHIRAVHVNRKTFYKGKDKFKNEVQLNNHF